MYPPTGHCIQIRWQPQNEEYEEAFKLLNIGKQQVLKQQMLELSKERVFYLTVLTRHAGNTDREMISHDLCLSGGQKQASRVEYTS